MNNLTNNLGIIQRYKNIVPFSVILNEYIERKFEALKKAVDYEIIFVNEEPYFTEGVTQTKAFVKMRFDACVIKRLKIWKGASDCTIFGVPEINWKFRALHDSFHIKFDLGFSAKDELLVNYLQQQEFSFDGLPAFELQLLNIETAGQILFYEQNKAFPSDQRKFAISELYKFYNYTKRAEKRPELFNESIKLWSINP